MNLGLLLVDGLTHDDDDDDDLLRHNLQYYTYIQIGISLNLD